MDNRQNIPPSQGVLLKPCFPEQIGLRGARSAGVASNVFFGGLGIDTKTSSAPLKSNTYKPTFYRPDTGEGVYFDEVVTTQTRRDAVSLRHPNFIPAILTAN
ncbi:MAG: hypothetical protein GY787_21035 [Alteromonadales bacterium]|nr:hypothetical protein [Alteromonadales bacterium]